MTNYVNHLVAKPIKYIFRRAGAEVVYHKLVEPYFAQTHAQIKLWYIGALNAATLGTGVYCSYVWGDLFNGFATKDASAFTNGLLRFSACAATVISLSAVKSSITQNLRFSWTNWSKEQATQEWLIPQDKKGNLIGRSANLEPEQRIPIDIETFTTRSETLTLGLVSSSVSLASFSAVLANISPWLCAGTLALGAAGTGALIFAGRNYVSLNHEAAAAQNAHRNAIGDANKYRTSIALWGGEEATQQAIGKRLDAVNQVGRKVIKMNVLLEAITSIYQNIAVFFPYAVIAPTFFQPGNNLSIGKVQQSYDASQNMRSSLDWFPKNQLSTVEWTACAKRITKFLTECGHHESRDNSPFYDKTNAELTLSVSGLVLLKQSNNPTEEPQTVLCENVSFDLKSGDHLAITGASGCGKSTLFLVLAGHLPCKDGRITYSGVTGNNKGEVLFVHQEPFVPDGSLAEALTYPKVGNVFSEDAMASVLEKVGLVHLTSHLKNERLDGYKFLSGGEKQRLNFARLLLHKPRIIGLDEVTPSLPVEEGIKLYNILFQELPDSIVISIAHQRELLPLHNIIAQLSTKELAITRTIFSLSEPTVPISTRDAMIDAMRERIAKFMA